jgi:hypothetical protein
VQTTEDQYLNIDGLLHEGRLENDSCSRNGSGRGAGSGIEPGYFNDDENCGMPSISRIAPLIIKTELGSDED